MCKPRANPCLQGNTLLMDVLIWHRCEKFNMWKSMWKCFFAASLVIYRYVWMFSFTPNMCLTLEQSIFKQISSILIPIVLPVIKELRQTSLQMMEASYSSSWGCRRRNPTMGQVSTLICTVLTKGLQSCFYCLILITSHALLLCCIFQFNTAKGALEHNILAITL